MKIFKGSKRRIATLVGAAIVATSATVAITTAPAQANGLAAGYSLPAGAASHWIGSYKVSGGFAFCADPKRNWPGTSSYSGIKSTDTWVDSVSGKRRSGHDVARVAWILHEYQGRFGNKDVSAAVDASIYAILSKGAYSFNGSLFNSRVDSTGHGTAIRDLSRKMLTNSNRLAGPYELTVTAAPTTVENGQTFAATAKVVAKYSGAGVPGKPISFTYNGVTRKATTNTNGVAKISFAASSGHRRVVASAGDMASSRLNYRTPDRSGSQRVLVRTSTAAVSGSTNLNFAAPDPTISTRANAATVQLPSGGGGAVLFDRVTVRGVDGGYRNTATATLYGPYATAPGRSSCTPDMVVATATADVAGPGTFDTTTVEVPAGGYYTWVANLPAIGEYSAATHSCGLTAETTFVGAPRSNPVIETTTSSGTVAVGGSIHDSVTVSGIELPCVDPRTGAPVANPDDLTCDAIEIVAGTPAVPALTAEWLADANGAGTPGCFDPRDLDGYVPSAVAYNATPQVQPAGGAADPKAYWASTGTQVDCEAVEVRAGTPAVDPVMAEDAPAFSATADAHLYGPYATLADATCTEEPFATVQFDITGNGTFQTPDVEITGPGVYTWVIDMKGNQYVEDVRTECGIEAETTQAKNQPVVTTETSEFIVRPGAEIFDTVVISGAAGTYAMEVTAELYGPFDSRGAMDCTGEPFATVTFPVTGNGEYITPSVTLEEYGYYTWVEHIEEDEQNFEVRTECGLTEETTLVQAQPELATQTSDQEVKVGSTITDTLIVSGIVGEFSETATANLYGPFASVDDIDCSLKPYASVEVTVTGNGKVETPGIKVNEPGYYTWHEEFTGNETNAGFTHDCGLTSETTLAKRPETPEKPEIPTGYTGSIFGWLAAWADLF